MRNSNGDPSQALVPTIPRVEEPEEQIVALRAVELSFPLDAVAQSSARIFVDVKSIIGIPMVLEGLTKRLEGV